MTSMDLLQALSVALNIPLSTVLVWVALVGGVASPLAALLPRPAADSRWAPLRSVVDKLAWNISNATNAALPVQSPHPVVGSQASAPATAVVAMLVGLLTLAACSQDQATKADASLAAADASVQRFNALACKVDGAVQPKIVTLDTPVAVAVNAAAPGTSAAVATFNSVDEALVHPTIVALCAAVGGSPASLSAAK